MHRHTREILDRYLDAFILRRESDTSGELGGSYPGKISGSPSLTLIGEDGRPLLEEARRRPRGHRRWRRAPGCRASRPGAPPSGGRRRASATASGGSAPPRPAPCSRRSPSRSPGPPAAGRRRRARCGPSRPSSASSAANTRPVYTHSAAWLMPTTRGRNHDEHASGTMPRRANTNPNLRRVGWRGGCPSAASSSRRRRPRPVDRRDHRLRALEDRAATRYRRRRVARRPAVCTSLPPRAKVSPPPDRSAPAQNPRRHR